MEDIQAVLLIFLGIFGIVLFINFLGKLEQVDRKKAIRAAGVNGELRAKRMIQSVIRADDVWFQNVTIEYRDKVAEYDNIIINSGGVYIIEVKNYSGKLVGGPNDEEWMKYKTTSAGNVYTSKVRNPLNQVNRQRNILKKYLAKNLARVSVDAHVLMVNGNSPAQVDSLLRNARDVNWAIHSKKNTLSPQDIKNIKQLIEVYR